MTELEELLRRLIAERESRMARWVLTTAAGVPVPSRPRRSR